MANGTEQLSAARSPRHRHATDDALTSNLGHQMGAGHLDDLLPWAHAPQPLKAVA
ncbi:hypothetical protein MHA02_41840 [Methylobacterium haplocladii]|uniref:Uncharacterized protein n=1 Tax=Methylobacterium haplocladii TaxID=1176176 RepID=A0A512IVQ4_9HYPH|nr:hypothetical protein MHA02_41840 [Methylobacterium haplocladii]